MRRGASLQANLPKLDVDQIVPDLAPIALPSPAGATDRLVRILAGRASMRIGLGWRDWAELAQRVLGIDEHLLGPVTRAWMEASLIDVASYARWWQRTVIARSPLLVGFRIGQHVGATLMGLALPTTRDELRRMAPRVNAIVEERLSVCDLVPQSLAFRLPSARHLDDLGLACQLQVSWLDMRSESFQMMIRHDCTSQPPSHYEWVRAWPHWSLAADECQGIEVEHRMRRDRPDFWVVSCGDRRIWTYDLNVARTWAAVLLGARALQAVGGGCLEAYHAYMPLPLARALSVLGAGLSGPKDGNYCYPIGFPRLREQVSDIVTQTFDPSRLRARAAREATG